jgi:hypothetical protein
MGEAENLARRAWARLGSRQESQAFVFLSVSSTAMTGAQYSLAFVTVASPAPAKQQFAHTSSRLSSRFPQRLSRRNYRLQPLFSIL